VTLSDLRALAGELFEPGALSLAGVGPDERLFASAIAPLAGDRQVAAPAAQGSAR
jgi:hypothetical protein